MPPPLGGKIASLSNPLETVGEVFKAGILMFRENAKCCVTIAVQHSPHIGAKQS